MKTALIFFGSFFNPYYALGFRYERQKTNKDKRSHEWTIFDYHQSNERQFIKWMNIERWWVGFDKS